jgi:hypothetical protein
MVNSLLKSSTSMVPVAPEKCPFLHHHHHHMEKPCLQNPMKTKTDRASSPMEWAVGCQSDPHTHPGSTCPPILWVDTPLLPMVQKPCPPPQLGELLWP